MAKEIHWVSEETTREIARRIESGELDFTDQQIAEIKDEMDKQGITIKKIWKNRRKQGVADQ